MKVFNVEVFDGGVSGNATPVYTSMQYAAMLGAVEKYFIQGYASQVSGNVPSINIKIQHSNDGENWIDKVNLGSFSLTANTNNWFTATDSSSTPSGAFVRFAISGVGSDLNCNLRLMVSGRAEQSDL